MEKNIIKKLDIVEVQITTACNMKCKYCFNGNEAKHLTLNVNQFERSVADALASEQQCLHFNTVRITGGEPLLEPQIVFGLISFCKENGLNAELSTNGILLPEFVSNLSDAGLSAVKISFDSFSEEIFYNHRGKYKDLVKKGIELVVSSPVKSVVRVTVSQENIREVMNTIERLLEAGVDFVEVKSIIPVGRADSKMMPSFTSLHKIMKQISEKWTADKVAILCSYLPFCEGYYIKNNVACTCGSSTMYVSAEGYIEPCSYFPRQRHYNIFSNSFEEAWTGSLFTNIRNGLNSKCGNCKEWEQCKNGCPAILYSYEKQTEFCYSVVKSMI